jgi:hypothetical protein
LSVNVLSVNVLSKNVLSVIVLSVNILSKNVLRESPPDEHLVVDALLRRLSARFAAGGAAVRHG